MSIALCVVALSLAVLAFGIYAAQVVCQLFRPATPVDDFLNQLKVVTTTAKDADTPAASIPDVTALITALGTLVDSLIKAGPTLTSLIASIFFMAIAVASGYFVK